MLESDGQAFKMTESDSHALKGLQAESLKNDYQADILYSQAFKSDCQSNSQAFVSLFADFARTLGASFCFRLQARWQPVSLFI